MMLIELTPTTCRRAQRLVVRGLGLAAGVCLLMSASGCQDSPITENDERSPFDRYDLIRDEYATPYVQDEYGRKRPNLRGRLIDRR